MRYAVSLAELLRGGLVLGADEVVAIALQLINAPVDIPARPPFGPLAAARIRIGDDGLVRCTGCDATPTVAELAILLNDLLRETAHVPGGLRYAVARALHEVDAPPFDSLDAFAFALARYAPPRPHETLRRIVARSDRRRPIARGDLRLQLREADRRLYESQRRADDTTRQETGPRGWLAAALLAGALTTIAAASVVGDRPFDMPPAPAPPATRPADAELADPAVHPVVVAPMSHVTSVNPKTPVRPRAHVVRMRWFHRTIAIRDDLTRP